VHVDIGALSDPGRKRPNNEDHFLVARFQRTMETLLTNLPEGTVPARHTDTAYGMLVADGMGGAAAGEVASRTAIGSLVDLALQTPDWIMRFDEKSVPQILERMKQRFQQLQEVLIERAQADPRLTGMGTTMTLALSLEAQLLVIHIGDSRAYLLRRGELHLLTRDQTMVQSLVDAGALRPEDVPRHPMRHILTGVITTKVGTIPVELHHVPLADEDQVLLCTDGLTDMLSDAAIAEALRAAESADAACRRLVDGALDAGGKDNVTVAVAKYRFEGPSGSVG
jgi:protein phosphatase